MTPQEIADIARQAALGVTPSCTLPPEVQRDHERALASIQTTLHAVERRLAKIDESIEDMAAQLNKAEGGRQSLLWMVGIGATVFGAIGSWVLDKIKG